MSVTQEKNCDIDPMRRLHRSVAWLVGAASCDLTVRQLAILATCAGEPAGSTVRALAATLQLDKPTVCRSADRLAGEGLLVRKADPADGRSVLLFATDVGSAVLRSAAEAGEAA